MAELLDIVEPRVRHNDVQIELHDAPPGRVSLPVSDAHRLRVHAGGAVRGKCSGHSFVYTRGDVDVFPAGVEDSWQQEAESRFLVVGLEPALLRRAAEEMGLPASRANLPARHQFRDAQIEHLAWALDAERRAGYPTGRIYTDTLALALAARVIGGADGAAASSASRQPSGLSRLQWRRLTMFVEAHLDTDLSLERLASEVGVGASHLKTLFRRSTGQAVHQYVIERRVARARELLEAGELPISQIALEVGFAHQSHLARWVRRLTGMTPAAIKRAAQPQPR